QSSSAPDALVTDLSPWSMFLHADIIVKIVMVGLAFASFVTWTLWLAKGFGLLTAKWRAQSATHKLEQANSLAEAAREIDGGWTRRGPVADLVQAALSETKRSADLSVDGVKERLAIAYHASRREQVGQWLAAQGCWLRSAQLLPSSACSARFGES